MESNSPPASTSPWKVGFLVSLLLVAMSIGVGYAITRTYGIEWTWIAFPGPFWYSFAFDLEAFKREMILLVAIVPAGALLSSLLVSGAVKKHRAKSDPAAEYKQLIRSLNKVKDLNDERKIRKIAGHRELRDFLVKVRNEVNEREKAVADREMALDVRESDESDAATGISSDALNAQAAILSSAIMNANEGGFKEALALTIPELQQVEEALRAHLDASVEVAAPAVDTKALDEAQRENERFQADLLEARASVVEVREELSACAHSAQEIETLVRQAQAAIDAPGAAPVDTSGSIRILDALDAASETLLALGDETKAIAISAATQASSAADAQNGIVEIADSMREIAGRFGQIAASWNQTTATARAELNTGSGNGAAMDAVAQVVQEASTRVSLWVERSTLLADRLNTVTSPSAPDATDDLLSPPESRESFDLGEDETLAKETREYDISIEKPTSAPDIDDVDTQAADAPGIVKEKKLFKEEAAGDDNFFVDIPGAETVDAAAEPAPVEATPEDQPAPAHVEPADEGFLQDPSREPKAAPEQAPLAADTKAENELPDVLVTTEAAAVAEDVSPNPVGEPDLDADAVDLYTLGAVDYQAQGAVPQN